MTELQYALAMRAAARIERQRAHDRDGTARNTSSDEQAAREARILAELAKGETSVTNLHVMCSVPFNATRKIVDALAAEGTITSEKRKGVTFWRLA